jgi:hypothetical protein
MYTLAALVVVAVIYFLFSRVARALVDWRGARLITCPETNAPAAVEVDSRHAAATVLSGKPDLRLRDCTRWPEKRDCGQECLRQIEKDEDGCLIRALVARWYAGKVCVICGQELGQEKWMERKPCVVDAAGITHQWSEFEPEAVPEVFRSHSPACWDCHVAEQFRRTHPELVTDRDR